MYKIINEYKKIAQLKKNVFSGIVFSGINNLIALIAFPIYLKYLGAEKYGLWITLAVILEFSQFGQLKIETAMIKFVAREYGVKRFKGITEYISTSLYILMITCFLIIIVLAFFKYQIAALIKLKKDFLDDGIRLIFYMGFLSGLSFFVNTIRGVMVGIGRMDIANYAFLFSRIFRLIMAVGLLILGYGVWSLYFSHLLYLIIPLILWIFILKYKYKIKIFDPLAFKIEKLKELIKLGGTLLVGSIANMFVVLFNKIIIARYVGLSAVTFYQIAYQLVMAIRSLLVLGLESILPKISEIYKKTIESLKSILFIRKKGMIFVISFGFPLFLSIFIFANPILKIWLGEGFDVQIAIVLRILLIGWLINTLAVPDYYMFIGIDKAGYSVSATCLKSFTNVILILFLLFLNIRFTLIKVVAIDSFSLIVAVIFLKYKYFEFRKLKSSS
ncbi:MAG: oligosaccharide flippase family protein [Candidatus Helarchaeota archaeon]